MPRPNDIRVLDAQLYLLPVRTRMPLKFGPETLTEVTCARVKLTVQNREGRVGEGWGETPLSVQWGWPSALSYSDRHDAMVEFCNRLARRWRGLKGHPGHPMELGHAFVGKEFRPAITDFNGNARSGQEPMPHLAALICASAFDVAVHDAYGVVNQIPTYDSYTRDYMNWDLSLYLDDPRFRDRYPSDFLVQDPPKLLPAWHLVGGKDPIDASNLLGDEPDDGYPVLLRDWIERDGLTSLKIKLRGDDAAWDYDRLVRVGRVAAEKNIPALSADFNCTVHEPAYVSAILDRLKSEDAATYERLLYVEQPFPYDLEANPINVTSVSARKPLFLDESAHDWKLIKLGKSLGWTGVALKTCKTQTGAILSLCWAKANGMTLMVQDLTNPMLAQIPHVLLAAHAGTIRGVETNAMQFYPEASLAEQAVHPGLYQRTNGCVDLSSLTGPGFGYRLSEIDRTLPDPVDL